MLKTIIIIFASFIFQDLIAQGYIIHDSTTLKKGIYKNFEELKFNRPSIDLKYQIKRKGLLPIDSSEYMFYRLAIDRDESEKTGEIIGFCDGKNIFLRSSPKNNRYPNLNETISIKLMSSFVKLDYLGRYCYNQDIYQVLNESEGIEVATDLTNGNQFFLTKEIMEDLIRSDTVLLKEFKESKRTKYKDYILRYSEKHKEDLLLYDSLIKKLEKDLYYISEIQSVEDYMKTLKEYENEKFFKEIEIWEEYYPNGHLKFIGAKAFHSFGLRKDYKYKIGTWISFYKSGQIKQIQDYNLVEKRNGRYQTFKENGDIKTDKRFNEDQEVK